MARAYVDYAKGYNALRAAEARAAEAASSESPAAQQAMNDAVARAMSVRSKLRDDAQRTRTQVRNEFSKMKAFGTKYEFMTPDPSEAAQWAKEYTSGWLQGFAGEIRSKAVNHAKTYGALSATASTTARMWDAITQEGCSFAFIGLVLTPFTLTWDLVTLPMALAERKRVNYAVQEANRLAWQADLAVMIAESPLLRFEEFDKSSPMTAEEYVQSERTRASGRASGETAGARASVEDCRRVLGEYESALKKAVSVLNSSSAPALGAWGNVPPNTPAMDIDPGILRLGRVLDPAPQSLDVPWAVELRSQPSVVLLCKDGGARKRAEDALGSAAIRAMSAFPPGFSKFTFIDLASAGSPFAAAVHGLAGTQLVTDSKTFMQPREVEQALSKALDDVGKRLQTLGHQYDDIDDLNRRSPGRKLPRHFILINGFPSGMTSDHARVVSTIIAQGGKCGVHVLVSVEPGTDMSRYMPNLDELPAAIVDVQTSDAKVRGAASTICLDMPPAAPLASVFVQRANEGGRSASKAAISYDSLDRERNASSVDGIRVPVGMDAGGALKYVQFGDRNPHALIQGRAGTGKSTLLHTIICGLAEQYSPDELELYLLDMKAVEFSGYGPRDGMPGLPHAKVISANSDAEFGVAVLRGVARLMEQRKIAFSDVGAQGISDFRRKSTDRMPRVLIVMDEFQRLFAGGDQDRTAARALLESVAREGRSFGIHMILATQMFASNDVSHSTMEQATLRISLRCGEAEAVALLGRDGASLAAELGAMGEGVVQDAGEHQVRNDIVKFALLRDEDRQRIIRNLAAKYSPLPGFVLFEGNRPAIPWNEPYFAEAVTRRPAAPPRRVDLWLGRPVGVDTSVGFSLRRDPGRNLGLFGPDADVAVGSMLACIASAAAQSRPGTLEFVFLNALRSDDDWGDLIRDLPSRLAHRAKNVGRSQIVEELGRLAAIIESRDPDDSTSPTILVMGFGMFNVSELRQSDPSFMTLIERGADRGVHFIGWWRTNNELTKHVDSKRKERLGGRLYFHLSSQDAGDLLPNPRMSGSVSRMERNRCALVDAEEPDQLIKIVPFSAQDRDIRQWADWLGRIR